MVGDDAASADDAAAGRDFERALREHEQLKARPKKRRRYLAKRDRDEAISAGEVLALLADVKRLVDQLGRLLHRSCR